MKRVFSGLLRSASRPGRLLGMVVGPGWVTVVPTRICITCVRVGAGVATRLVIGLGG
jgi:hypothetical protein